MTNIKCRYSFPKCTRDDYEIQCFDSFWACDDNSGCHGYTKPDDVEKINGVEIVNPRCIYCKFHYGEFEKNVKNYDYFDGDLKVAGKTYEYRDIDYLEIDGRVLINDTEEN